MDFTISRSVASMSYSLDGAPGVGLLGNVTLQGLSVGVHNVSVCVVDGFGNVGDCLKTQIKTGLTTACSV